MRKLMWFAIGFAGACAAFAYGMGNVWIFPSVLLAVLAGIAAVIISSRKSLMQPLLGILAGCMAGTIWFGMFHFAYVRPVTMLDGEQVRLTITSSDYSRITEYGAVLEGTSEIGDHTYQLWVYLSDQTVLRPGDSVTGDFYIRLTTPGGLRESTIFQGKGIFLVASQRGELEILCPETIEKRHYPALLAETIRKRLEELFPEDVYPFTKALLLGDTLDLDYGLDTAFKISGIRHIVAVSGLHISILYGLICIVTLRKRFLTAAVGIPVLILFAAVAGLTPSALRACIMVSLMLLAQLLNREYDPPTALSFAVLVMLSVNPMAVVSASLQLSAGCVAGIFLFSQPVCDWLKERIPGKKGIRAKIRNAVCTSISLSLSAMSLTAPLCACYFGMVSLIGPLTNLLTLWVVNLIFNGLVVTGILYLISPAAAAFLASLLAWPIRYVQQLARMIAGFPLAAVYTTSIYVVIWLVFIYILLTVFLIMKEKQPGKFLCYGVAGLCLALILSWAEPLMSDTRITMLDVGQGQAIILQSEGKTFLVDCGGDDDGQTADLIAGTLLSQGISRLDGIVLTHYDRDHAGAIHHLLARVETDCLFLPDTQNKFDIPQTDGEMIYVWEDMELSFGASKLKVYGPVYSGLSNENSLCVLFDTENCDILITGDRSSFGERMLLRNRMLQDVDILVAGHHGAGDSTSEDLLRAVTPETVLISVARDNIYDHPAPALLQRLEKFGCTVYRTDKNGTITIRR